MIHAGKKGGLIAQLAVVVRSPRGATKSAVGHRGGVAVCSTRRITVTTLLLVPCFQYAAPQRVVARRLLKSRARLPRHYDHGCAHYAPSHADCCIERAVLPHRGTRWRRFVRHGQQRPVSSCADSPVVTSGSQRPLVRVALFYCFELVISSHDAPRTTLYLLQRVPVAPLCPG